MGGKILRRAEKDIIEKIKRAGRIIFFLDYDGTLTPIRKKPSLAGIKKSTIATLKKLAKNPHFKVFIISGRSLKDVKNLIGIKSIFYIGNHGIELSGPNLSYVNRRAKSSKPYIQETYRILKKRLKSKGVIVENKNYTLSIHYRLLSPLKVRSLLRIFNDAVRDIKKDKKIMVTEGKKVLEVRPAAIWNKGKIVKWVLTKSKKSLPICIGDDITDEDAFRAIGKTGITILVSEKKRGTRAQYRLTSPEEVIKFLKRVTDHK